MVEFTEQQAKAFDLFVNERKNMREISLLLGVSYTRVVNILNEILIKTGYKDRKTLFQEGKTMEFSVKNA